MWTNKISNAFKIGNSYVDYNLYANLDITALKLQQERIDCYQFLCELDRYAIVNHKETFYGTERIRLKDLIEGDELSIELAKQIILERLNK